mmetsp:Transcript_3583/g.7005  ORF Transcript_3583/g.7005 Transcript_3583/m.7005 type:complete len:217 (-) Transcript_3583:1626-2276(-)
MRHFATHSCGSFSIPMPHCTSDIAEPRELPCRPFCCWLIDLTYDIDHQGRSHPQICICGQWQIHNCTDMSLKLVAPTSLHGVVTRVVGPRGHLIKRHGPVSEDKKLNAKDACSTVAKALHGLPCYLLGPCTHSGRAFCWTDGGVADGILSSKIDNRVDLHLARLVSHHHDCHLPLIGTPLLCVTLAAAQTSKSSTEVSLRANDRIAFAIIAATPCL